VQPRARHVTADGRAILVIHGHELDTVVQNIKWLALIGDVGYQALLKLNAPINFMRRKFGLGYWSLSAYVKKSVKNAVSFIGKFEESIVRYSREENVRGVLCGHIHSPALREEGEVAYYNCGDWVESCSALVEDFEGKLHLIFRPPEQSVTQEKLEAPEEPPLLPEFSQLAREWQKAAALEAVEI
jgi:UDP-2,3-diacylglucosamine pyrophosphatase LpxH